MKSTLIRIEATPHGHTVRLFVDEGDDGWIAREVSSADLSDPPDEPRREAIRRALLEGEGDSAELEQIGRELRELLLANPVGKALASQLAREEPRRFLIDAGTDELRCLPWELIRSADDLPLFPDLVHPFARAAPGIDVTRQDPGRCWPLRVLLVVGTADTSVEAEAETEYVRDAFRRVCGLVDLEILERPTLPELRAAYEQLRPHVFHFVGHGALDASGRGFLKLERRGGDGAVAWTRQLINAMFRGWQPRLAVLNACQSGDLGQQQGVHSVAAAFAGLGIGAVVAMQGQIHGPAAAKFAAGMYGRLAAGDPIDVAVANARVEIMMVDETDNREHALPTLLLSRIPESVIDLSPGERSGILKRESFRRVTAFVNRAPARRELWDRLERRDARLAPSALAVVGDESVGKSALVRWYLGVRALRGDNAAYVDLDRGNTLDTGGLLRAIASALADAPEHGPPNAKAMAAYAGEVEPMLPLPDDWSKVFGAFRRALEAAATRAPVVIGLDHIAGVESWAWRQLACEHLVRPIAAGNVPGVRLILAVRGAERTHQLPGGLAEAIDEVKLRPLPRDEYVTVATQFMRSYGIQRESLTPTIEVLHSTLAADWGGAQFKLLELLATTQVWELEP